jgi:hypothetical protein
LQQARQQDGWAWDPRLSLAGNRIARRLTSVLDGLGRRRSGYKVRAGLA